MAKVEQRHRAQALALVSNLGCWGRNMEGQPETLGHIDIDLVAKALADAESAASSRAAEPHHERAADDAIGDLLAEVDPVIGNQIHERVAQALAKAAAAEPPTLHETLSQNIRACAAAVRMACGVSEGVEVDAEQLRLAAVQCRDLGAALRKAIESIAEPPPAQGEGRWVRVQKPDGVLAVDEGQAYLFAIEVSTNGAPPQWEYFSDALVWDAETDPEWSDGGHGWDMNDEMWFRPLPPPPATETK